MKNRIKKLLKENFIKNKPKISYSCVLLDEKSHDLLLKKFNLVIPDEWKKIAHHMTINLGELKNKEDVGKYVILTVTKIGESDKAIAVMVEGYPSPNQIPHVTLAINPNGGKAKDSKNITNWKEINPFQITGIVSEIPF